MAGKREVTVASKAHRLALEVLDKRDAPKDARWTQAAIQLAEAVLQELDGPPLPAPTEARRFSFQVTEAKDEDAQPS